MSHTTILDRTIDAAQDRVVSALGEVWGTTPSALARAIEKPVADEALDELGKKLDDLGDLDL